MCNLKFPYINYMIAYVQSTPADSDRESVGSFLKKSMTIDGRWP